MKSGCAFVIFILLQILYTRGHFSNPDFREREREKKLHGEKFM